MIFDEGQARVQRHRKDMVRREHNMNPTKRKQGTGLGACIVRMDIVSECTLRDVMRDLITMKESRRDIAARDQREEMHGDNGG